MNAALCAGPSWIESRLKFDCLPNTQMTKIKKGTIFSLYHQWTLFSAFYQCLQLTNTTRNYFINSAGLVYHESKQFNLQIAQMINSNFLLDCSCHSPKGNFFVITQLLAKLKTPENHLRTGCRIVSASGFHEHGNGKTHSILVQPATAVITFKSQGP